MLTPMSAKCTFLPVTHRAACTRCSSVNEIEGMQRQGRRGLVRERGIGEVVRIKVRGVGERGVW